MRKLLVLFLLMNTFAMSKAQVSDSMMNAVLTATIDSTKADAFTQISKKWAPSNFDSSLYYATKAIEFAKKADSPFHLGHAYNAGGLSYGYAYSPSEAWPYYEKAIIEFLKIGDQELAGAMYTNSGVDYYLAGQLDSAMIRYTSAIIYHSL